MDILLEARDLNIVYCADSGPETPAVRGVSFDIHAGEAVGLLGESGCGKTTTALTLARLLPWSARIIRGSVRFRNKELLTLPEQELERLRGAEISLVFQEPSIALNPVMRVGDQIAEVVRAHRSSGPRRCRAAAESALARVHLADISRIYSAYPHELSGGQKQRVLIAQALACGPSLVIMDEPTTGLDTVTQAEILGLLGELKTKSQTAFLFISHHPRVLAGLADRLLVMYAGQIVEEGALTRIHRSPRHPYTQGLLRSLPANTREEDGSAERRLVPIPGAPPDMKNLPPGCSFAPRCSIRMDVCALNQPQAAALEDGCRVRCFAYGN